MKKLFLLLTSSFVFACSSNQIINIDDKDVVELTSKVNEISKVKVLTNPTTGYSWDIKIDDENSRLMINNSYESTNNTPGIVGAPSYQIIELKPLETGVYKIKLEYKRGWENVEPINKKEIILNVK